MPVEIDGPRAVLSDTVTIEEVDALAQWARGEGEHSVDVSAAVHVHTAALQLLVALRPSVIAPPVDPYLAEWVMPLFGAERAPTGTQEQEDDHAERTDR